MKYNKISVFEYDQLKLGCTYNDIEFTGPMLNSLELFHATSKTKYFKLIRHGVEFCEYVGVLQVDGIQIEILPKLDRNSANKDDWRKLLIGMLGEVGMLRVTAPSSSGLTLKSNSILELYFEIFISEVEYLIHTGLIRQYRQQEINQTSLKGALDFPKQLSKNLIHKEKFYTKSSIYDYDHIWHRILSQTICLIRILSQNSQIHNRIGALELDFPEVSVQGISEQTFINLVYSRKTEAYRTAIEIARLLLLRFHPNLASGNNHVLALMFDMNVLWESFIYHSLRKQFLKHKDPYTIHAQASTRFWKAYSFWRYIRPDILIKSKDIERSFVLDTKWKDISKGEPSASDLQQLFAYSQFFNAAKVALVYPGHYQSTLQGQYASVKNHPEMVSCWVIKLELKDQIRAWQEAIYETVISWMDS